MLNFRALKLLTTLTVVATSVFAQDHSSEKAEAQISGAHYCRLYHALSLFAKKYFSQTRTPNAQYILTRPWRRTFTISHRYGSLRHSSRAIVPASRCSRKLRLAFRISHLRASSMEAPST